METAPAGHFLDLWLCAPCEVLRRERYFETPRPRGRRFGAEGISLSTYCNLCGPCALIFGAVSLEAGELGEGINPIKPERVASGSHAWMRSYTLSQGALMRLVVCAAGRGTRHLYALQAELYVDFLAGVAAQSPS